MKGRAGKYRGPEAELRRPRLDLEAAAMRERNLTGRGAHMRRRAINARLAREGR